MKASNLLERHSTHIKNTNQLQPEHKIPLQVPFVRARLNNLVRKPEWAGVHFYRTASVQCLHANNLFYIAKAQISLRRGLMPLINNDRIN